MPNKGSPSMVKVNNKHNLDWHPTLTVKEILEKLGYNYSLITVTINGEFIPKENYETEIVPDEAKVIAFHLAHGG